MDIKNTKNTKKNMILKKKTFKGGGKKSMGVRPSTSSMMSRGMMSSGMMSSGLGQMAKRKLDIKPEKCELMVKSVNKFADKSLYTEKKLMKKLESVEFIKYEPQGFKEMFSRNLKAFCVTEKNGYHLKFCYNLVSCLKRSHLFFEMLNDLVSVDEKNDFVKKLYNQKKKAGEQVDMADLVEEEKTERCKAMADFLINVVFKSINEYQKKHPPNSKKSDKNKIYIKNKLEDLFRRMMLDIDIKSVDNDALANELKNKTQIIKDFARTRDLTVEDTADIIKNKDKRSSMFIGLVVSLLLSVITIESGIFDAPPGVSAGVS
tara:strand:+ start:597 stop:1550 length:954 start_codon:yes stop_codon:yes gene_type:complete